MFLALLTGGQYRESLRKLMLEIYYLGERIEGVAESVASVGQPNKLMLENAEYVMKSDVPVIIRIPLIPGITEKTQNLLDIAEFVKRVNPSTPVDLLPYHRFGVSKCRMMDRAMRSPSRST